LIKSSTNFFYFRSGKPLYKGNEGIFNQTFDWEGKSGNLEEKCNLIKEKHSYLELLSISYKVHNKHQQSFLVIDSVAHDIKGFLDVSIKRLIELK
jgi:hypothetical protein